MYPCHPRPLCGHRRPCWQRSGSRPATAATSAAVALGGEAPHAGRQGAPHRRRAAGHARCRAALPAPWRARRPAEPGGLDAAAGGVEALRCPAVSSPPASKRICGPRCIRQRSPGALERAPKMHLRPRAISGHPVRARATQSTCWRTFASSTVLVSVRVGLWLDASPPRSLFLPFPAKGSKLSYSYQRI
jgi:hypothetical protein